MARWLDALHTFAPQAALLRAGGACTFAELAERVAAWRVWLARYDVRNGAVVAFGAECDAASVSLLLALILNRNIIVPLSTGAAANRDVLMELAEVSHVLDPGSAAPPVIRRRSAPSAPLLVGLRKAGRPGLVLFSSGSTGQPKGAVHDLTRLLGKFDVPRPAHRTLVFLQLDHIGGLNTLFHTLSNGGAVVTAPERTPAAVCEAIEACRVSLLPTSPTFLNLLLLSGEHLRRDLSSLELITYGTEPMPASTLRRLAETFPNVRLLQTYGSTEIGILRSKSRDSGSLWVRVGGEGCDTKIVDGRLWVRTPSAMLGYLNAPSPFDADGFFDTGDLVERDGDWLRILGRTGDIINVGGSKVWPAEVESVLLELPNVADVIVRGAPHPLVGQIVVATVRLAASEPLDTFKVRLRRFCRDRLAAYKVPSKIVLAEAPLHSARFKRARSGAAQVA